MESNSIFQTSQNCGEDVLVFRRIISLSSSQKYTSNDENAEQWDAILAYTIRIITANEEIGNERISLASHAFFALFSVRHNSEFFENSLMHFIKMNSNQLYIFGVEYRITDLELFKLTCTYGYLQANPQKNHSDDITLSILDVLYNNCIIYSRYSYFAYKILYTWLRRSMHTNFWDTCELKTERKLETILFSNWCNSISDIRKQNATSIFNMYLKIMVKKYNRFLEFIFKQSVDNISWQNETKYTILAEVCNIWNNLEAMVSKDFLLSLCTSLTKNYLRCSGTKVYINIMNKLESEDKWKESFGPVIKTIVERWESGPYEKHDALRSLCKYWLEVTIIKHRNILSYLWLQSKDLNGCFYRSHLERMASEMHIYLEQSESDIQCYMNHKDEIIRLNGFAIYCQRVNELNIIEAEPFLLIKQFLWHNANTTAIYVREGIMKYFKVFYGNVLKTCDNDPEFVQHACDITNWLHVFLLDCFEIGSCYQRKIFGLNLYKAILSFTDEISRNGLVKNAQQHARYNVLLQRHLKTSGNWKFTDKKSLFVLLKLVLDTALDVRETATGIILNYFNRDALSDVENSILLEAALENCNSSKFYKTESGAGLMKILANWLPLHSVRDIHDKDIVKYKTYSEYLLNEAQNQLTQMKRDLLKAVVHNRPFFGVLTAILKLAFQNGPENHVLTSEFIDRILNLLEDAVNFFLYVLSLKSANTEYSSSFAEMGLAIDDIIKTSEIDNKNEDDLSLSPAHQVLVSCIWISLKISCEILSEIGMLMRSEDTVKRSADIIVTVLLKCRHKGVVEAAGVTISNLTRCLCKKEEYVDLPKLYITNLLGSDTKRSLNITRRGAGLTIMFHRIVIGDNRRDRPLMHFAVETLLNSLKEFPKLNTENVKSQHDSPLARRLHFLRALVADKEIHAQFTPYLEEIALTCFKYLQSEIWTIRNASLQLFGAVVPRLVGQNFGGISLDFGSGYSINHFVTHYPVLANHVLNELQSFSSACKDWQSNRLSSYSSAVHILTLVSKFSCGGCDLIDYSSEDFIAQIKGLLYIFLGNSIIHVRFLAAKAYTALTSFLRIHSEIRKLEEDIVTINNVNLLHGYLLTIKYLQEKLAVEMENVNPDYQMQRCVEDIKQERRELSRFRHILNIWKQGLSGEKSLQLCYIVETMILQLSESMSDHILSTDFFHFNDTVASNLEILSSQKMQPGFFQFLDIASRFYANYIKRTKDIDVKIIEKILNSKCIEQAISFLNELSYNAEIFEIVLKKLIQDDCHGMLLNAMIIFVLQTIRHSLKNIDRLKVEEILLNSNVKFDDIAIHADLYHVKCVILIAFCNDEGVINEILLHFLKVSVNEEESARRMIAECMQLSIHRFVEFGNSSKLLMVQCCIVLLKDEVTEIAETIATSLQVHVLSEITENISRMLQHKEIVYQRLLFELMHDQRSLVMSSTRDKLEFIKLFTQSSDDFDIDDIAIENPFHHEDSPFYKEESKFLNISFFCMHHNEKYKWKTCQSQHCKNQELINVTSILQTTYQLQKGIGFDYNNLKSILNFKYIDYLMSKREAVTQECYD